VKLLFIFLFFFFLLFGLTIQKRSVKKYYRTMSHITVTCHMSYHMMELHDEHEKVVHRLYSSYISIQNLIETPSSSLY